ncbi:DUF3667 domain-containing protein [Pedobacter metabolipauper]|uniref:Uncharacterized protein DUF3667 n=1 Tax=Pedobacter metabolipauper TaxID=425513 RepID=A0A4R6SYY8_9SPHI|nr:DUF3667 domain-containing protein [Pedobacter metabolipauper]TDQ11834.1 uncharacterized protein DUF3667 [Pedobacter metabolipauper]
MSNCKHCNHELTGSYCSNCGLPIKIKRIDSHYIIHEIEHVLHFEKGILFTIRELLVRPGQNIREFITDNRNRLVKPIIFVILSSLIYTLTIHYFHIEDGYVNSDDTKGSSVSLIFNWIQSHYGYANIMMGIFIAFWLKLFFRKYNYNFFEMLILLCFVMGMGMLIFAAFALLEGLTKLNIMKGAGVAGVGYCTWAIGHFFEKMKVASYLKAFASYMLGMISFFTLAFLLGLLIDVLIKH